MTWGDLRSAPSSMHLSPTRISHHHVHSIQQRRTSAHGAVIGTRHEQQMANGTQVPVVGAGTFLKFRTNWASAPSQARCRWQLLVGTHPFSEPSELTKLENQYMLVIELGELKELAAKLGEISELNDKLAW
ncbi:hypothetical protein PCANC_23724 [Puccinia coronata f. sp. avenae]|uniref:Uncharacterized protein n=1 Tax=Puccinia coronata f. sp. avenae TaxID=200324 RepID=A0A2N5TYN2_9BASI|nr:hypothetical protein PCANC_25114 [Puccinia coronata f. sp. avenae]PLW30615.1 hypothetical protein PCANC_23724 [Puccinia coronata f. sp. avenae]